MRKLASSGTAIALWVIAINLTVQTLTGQSGMSLVGTAHAEVSDAQAKAMMSVLQKLDRSFACNKELNECRVRSTER